jgi:uncharacterized OB-fold protein
MAEEQGDKQCERKMIPVQEGLFTMPDSPQGFHLLGSRCKSCGTVAFPQKRHCVKCFGDEIEVVPLSSDGKIATWTVIRMKPFGYQDKVPYVLADVILPERLHLMTQLSGIDPEKPEIVGRRVESC